MDIIELSIPRFFLYFGAKKWHFRCLTQNTKTTVTIQAYPNVAHGTFKSSMYPLPHMQTKTSDNPERQVSEIEASSESSGFIFGLRAAAFPAVFF